VPQSRVVAPRKKISTNAMKSFFMTGVTHDGSGPGTA
jgi:hypothetical protein